MILAMFVDPSSAPANANEQQKIAVVQIPLTKLDMRTRSTFARTPSVPPEPAAPTEPLRISPAPIGEP
jgi:hypothetical protein